MLKVVSDIVGSEHLRKAFTQAVIDRKEALTTIFLCQRFTSFCIVPGRDLLLTHGVVIL
jgi:hypothetical protein